MNVRPEVAPGKAAGPQKGVVTSDGRSIRLASEFGKVRGPWPIRRVATRSPRLSPEGQITVCTTLTKSADFLPHI